MTFFSGDLFELRKPLKKNQSLILSIVGLLILLVIWVILTMGEEPLVKRQSLPHPGRVLGAFSDLLRDNNLIQNITLSLSLNYGGYIKAILWGLPLGYLIGLIPLVRGLFQRHVDAVRFIPLTAVTVLFIVWFGSGTEMKVNFLAFGIFIYLLPTMIGRIDEVDDVYMKTVYTLGASRWQTFTNVYIPSVLSKIFEDIRVLTAISWTYIIFVETIGSEGGIGQLIYSGGQRQGRIDKVYALLIIIMLIGVFQDRLFGYLDRKFFPFKYQVRKSYEKDNQLKEISVFSAITDFTVTAVGYIFLAGYILLALNEIFGFLGALKPLDHFFGERVWVVHFIGILVLGATAYSNFKRFNR